MRNDNEDILFDVICIRELCPILSAAIFRILILIAAAQERWWRASADKLMKFASWGD